MNALSPVREAGIPFPLGRTASKHRSSFVAGFRLLPDVFSRDETGWLANEARILGLRQGSPGRAATINDPHRHEHGFGLLARHPRILRHIRRLLDDDLRIRRSQLWPGMRSAPERWRCCGAVTAIIFLDEPRGPGYIRVLSIRPRFGDHTAEESCCPEVEDKVAPASAAGVPISSGAAVLLERDVAFRFDVRGHLPPLMIVSFSAARGLHPTIEAPDHCLWPSPYWSAG